MTPATIANDSGGLLSAAVHRNRALSANGLLERAFTLAFRNLVYAQIWEDPVVDLEALDVRSDSRIVTIASGGCNAMSYLTANPARIFAVDLNSAHVSLNRLKCAAAQTLPNHAAFYRFCGNAADVANIQSFDTHIAPALDRETLKYWTTREPSSGGIGIRLKTASSALMKMPVASICGHAEPGAPRPCVSANNAIRPSAMTMFAAGPAAPTSAASRRG